LHSNQSLCVSLGSAISRQSSPADREKEEELMAIPSTEKSFRAGSFNDRAKAENALNRLQEAGFTHAELAVICPENLQGNFAPGIERAELPGSHAVEAILEGGAAGAALGGLTLAATAIATGGIGLIPAIPVLIGGGALAGGFSGLIVADGYGKEVGEYYQDALRLGEILVGVKLEEDNPARLDAAEQIIKNAGGRLPAATAH